MPDTFIDLSHLRAVLDAWREGDLLTLAASPLARTALVEDILLAGEVPTPDTRARALQAVMRWAVERLRPDGAHSWTAQPWRAYNVIYHFYEQGMPLNQLADKLGVVVQTIYDTRATALTTLAKILGQELHHPQATAARQQVYLAARYARRPASEQRTLCALALFRQPIPLTALESLVGPELARVDWAALLTAHWILSDPDHRAVSVHPQARAYLLTQISPAQQPAWHRALARYYADQQDYLAAVEHWRAAGEVNEAAALLITHYTDMLNAGQTEPLRLALANLLSTKISATHRAQLYLLTGQLAEAMQDVNTALEEYGKALGVAPEPALKAEACYRLARVFRARDVTQSLTHYQRCIELLDSVRLSDQPPLRYWMLAWVGLAMIYMSERLDLAQARATLDNIEPWVMQVEPDVQTRCYNALGQWAYWQKDYPLAVQHLSRAWVLAVEGRDLEMQLHVGYNLGSIYAELKEPQALAYLTEALEAAKRLGLRRNEILCLKGLGEYYFRQAAYAPAADYYQKALEIAQAMDNRTWQAALYYDLAETWASAGAWGAARACFQTGQALALELGAAHYIDLFAALVVAHPALLAEPVSTVPTTPVALTPRQQRILAYAQTHSPFTSTQCAEHLSLSKEHTIRELNLLVEQGHLTRTGVGRGTRYGLAARG